MTPGKTPQARYYWRNAEAIRAKQRVITAALRASRIAAGLCTSCGDAAPRPFRRICAACNARIK